MFEERLLHSTGIGDVEDGARARFFVWAPGGREVRSGRHDTILPVHAAKRPRQLRSDLPECAGDKNTVHLSLQWVAATRPLGALGCLAVSTGHCALRTTLSATLPINISWIGPRPWVPITIMSMSCSSA